MRSSDANPARRSAPRSERGPAPTPTPGKRVCLKTAVDARLREQAARFSLRFSCEDCCHHGASGDRTFCSMGFPAEPMRAAPATDELAFCKSFELG